MLTFRQLTPTGRVPKATENGFLFFADLGSIGETKTLYPQARAKIETGCQVMLPETSVMHFMPSNKLTTNVLMMRPFLHFTETLTDLEFLIANLGDHKVTITHGDQIAVGVLTPILLGGVTTYRAAE